MKALRVSLCVPPGMDSAKQENYVLTSGLFTNHKAEEKLSTGITNQEAVNH